MDRKRELGLVKTSTGSFSKQMRSAAKIALCLFSIPNTKMI